MKYRIVTNGEWYEIERRPWWFPFWSRVQPSRYALYRPIDWSNYKFDTVEDAKKRIGELKEARKKQKWQPVSNS